MNKVLVIKTGELLDIKFSYKNMKIEIDLENFSKETQDTMRLWTSSFPSSDDTGNEKDGFWYTLSDGMKYHEDELIVGLDNIRDYKLKNIIE